MGLSHRKLSEYIVDIHQSLRNEGGSSVLLDALQDEMASRWYDLTDEQKKRLWGLSADLYVLQDAPTPPPFLMWKVRTNSLHQFSQRENPLQFRESPRSSVG